MINAIVRSPAHFFDSTPSGMLTNKFSNDLGLIDNGLMTVLFESIEGILMIVVTFTNIIQLNAYYILPILFFSKIQFQPNVEFS